MVTCIIACFNEEKRINDVLNVVTPIKAINEIICVDDGSLDQTANIINSFTPRVKLIKFSKNRGKSAAIQEGLKQSKGEFILLMDADKKNLVEKEIVNGINLIVNHKDKVDMIIFKHLLEPFVFKLSRSNILISGERILKKEDLLRVFALHPMGFQLEVMINQYMIQHNKQVYWVPSSAINPLKREKYGLIKGVILDLHMTREFIFRIGPLQYFKQYLNFAKEKAPSN